jgi:uncharacterized BrkB/YihY/UPF0761 family membrane protein
MSALKTQIRLTMVLGVLSLIAGVFSHLALTDIAHGGEDLSLEWNVLRASALVVLIFIGFALFTLRKALKQL